MRTAYAFDQIFNYTKTGVVITMSLKDKYCLLSTDFFFNVTSNMTVTKITCELYNSEEVAYSETVQDTGILYFEYEIFSTDLIVEVEVKLTY